jgi:soluble lytic murein transglycosylase-like protein
MKQRMLMIALLAFATFHAMGGKLATDKLDVQPLPADASAVSAIPAHEAATRTQPEDPDERAVLSFLRSRHTGLSQRDEENVARAVVHEAKRHDLDSTLVLAVIQVESGGFNFATSHVGALGLMQLLPSTAEEFANRADLDWRGTDSLFDPVMNVKIGTAYIKHLTDKYGDVSTALAAYNWGPGRIDRRIRKGSSVPSIYIERVMKAFDVALSRREDSPTAG